MRLPKAAPGPNILLITIDSLRADRLGCSGYPLLTTPHIDALAAKAALFTNTYSPHVPTTPAYASMLTGMDCFTTEVVAFHHPNGLPDRIATLAEILTDAGYTSACIGFGSNSATRGFHRRFDYDNYLDPAPSPQSDPGFTSKAVNLNRIALPELVELTSTGQPFFLCLCYMDVHTPYLPPEPFDTLFYHGALFEPANASMRRVLEFKPFRDYLASWLPEGLTDIEYVIAQYDGALAHLDVAVASLLHELETLRVLDDTVVVLTADHGESLAEHDCWFDHHGLYDVVLKVPLMIRYPRRIAAPVRISGYNQLKDLVPTLLDLAAIETRIAFDGSSLLPLIEGSHADLENEFYITECTWMRKHGWRTTKWKFIEALEPDFHGKPPVELYDLTCDGEETQNLARALPDVTEELRARMRLHIEERERQTQRSNPMSRQGGRWHGIPGITSFDSSREAYDHLYLGPLPTRARLPRRLRRVR
jgi:arylsulfatase A-like enzyme